MKVTRKRVLPLLRRGPRPWPVGRGRIALTVAALLAAEAAMMSMVSGAAFAAGQAGDGQMTTASDATEQTATTAGSVAAALLMARVQDRKIEATSERTETSTTYALPSGELQTAMYAGPIRKKVDGAWRDIDTSLSDTGSTLEPDVAAADIKVSDGGDTELASVSKGEKTFGMGWETALPAPSVKNDTAAYDLGNDQTLTVTALAQGFNQNVLVESAPRDQLRYRIPLRLQGLELSVADSGHLLLKDDDGKLVAEAPAPMMWDSSTHEVSGESAHQARVDTKVETAEDGSQALVLTPDPDYFAQDLTYPVTVDPTSTLAATTDTWVATNYTDSQVSSTELKSGTYDAGSTKARSYLKFDVSAFKGKHITDTNLALYSYYSSTCATTGAGTQIRRITSSWSSSDITWSDQPSTTTAGAVTNTAAKGYSSTDCPAGTMNFDIDTIVQAWANGSANHGLRVAGADETDSYTWRRFRSANYVSGDGSTEPHLTVTYNSYPSVPASVSVSPSQLNAYNGRRYVTSLTPTLSAKVTDPDGSKTKAVFEVTADPAYADTTYSYTGTSASVASGSTAALTVPSASAFPAGAHLRYRVRAYDGTDYGSWTGYTTFVLNTAKPAAPAISCDTYEEDGWTARADTAVSCTLDTDSTDGAGYHWGLDDSSLPNKKLDTTNGTGGDAQTVSIDPADGWHTLYARTVDSGGNTSTATTAYAFGVGADGAAVLSPQDGDDTARRLTLSAKGLTSYTGVTWQYRRGEEDSWHTVPLGDVTASGDPVSSWPVKVTDGTSAKLVWNVTDSLTEDGAIDLRAAFTDGATTGHSQTVEVTVDRDAGYAVTGDVGPGEVNLLTGDFTLSATDAEGYNSGVERTFSSRANSKDTEGLAQIFGPGWTSTVVGDTADGDYTQIRQTSGTSLELLSGDGGSIAFTATAGGGWAAEDAASDLTLTGALTGKTLTLTDTDANVTVFARADADAPTWVLASSAAAVDESTLTVVSETVPAGEDTLTRPKYVISPSGAVKAATCQADPSTRGCRVLEYVYADTTTATDASFGTYQDQVDKIRLWATDPGADEATPETVAQYAYGSSGRLREVWDPRVSPALKITYTYDGEGRVQSVTEAGELPWTFTYGEAGSAPTAGAGMLLKASRPALEEGSTTVTSGTAATTVVYDVPLAGDSAPYQMDKDTVATWAQDEAPTDAAAVFPADATPLSSTGGDLSADTYRRATITYINANGDETNTATPGGSLDVTEYDSYGNTVAELSAANRELALGTGEGATDDLARLGLTDRSAAERAELLADLSLYSADGERLTEQYGPLRLVTLSSALPGTTGEATLPAGTVVPARAHVSYAYDEGRPDDAAVSGLATSTRTGAYVEGYTEDADTRAWATRYDWTDGHQTAAIEDPDGKALTTTTTYDSDGRMTSSGLAASSGSDAGTLTYTYYTADGSGTCAGRPEWAGLLCRTAPAATVEGGGDQPNELVTTVYTYDRWGRTATKEETAGGVTRTSVTETDEAGRTTRLTVTGGTGEETPATEYTYSPTTGRITEMSAQGQTVSYGYDALGRQISYEDGTGNTTTSTYDRLDRVVKVTDSAPSTTTYTYDEADQVATVTDSAAGVFGAAYDADGALTTETLPGGHTLALTRDTEGNVTSKEYTDSEGTTVLSDSASYTVHGQQAGHTQTDGSTTESDYTYDTVGRLTEAADTTASGCTTRAYSFDTNSNRTGLSTTSDDCDSATDDANTDNSSYTYDSADRLITDGISYDAFGRTTRTGNTELAYYTNDLIRSETVGTDRKVWSMDAVGRLNRTTTQTLTDGAWSTSSTETSHYASSGDSPTWSEDSDGVRSRNVTDATGTLAAVSSPTGDTVLQLTTLHGDVAVRLPLDDRQAAVVQHFDEYGNALDAAGGSAYGWLGGYQRSSDTLSGITLMGSRIYDPGTGRFLQTDPEYGGNTNAYVYPADPVNAYDLDGRFVIVIPIAIAAEWAVTALIALVAAAVTAYICHIFGCTITASGTGVRVPWPDKKSKTAKKYKNKTYWGYKIYRKKGGRIYKYGITRAGKSRPASQIKSCQRYYGKACSYKMIWRGKGWYNARAWEATKILKYVAHHGHCPPGQLKSCR